MPLMGHHATDPLINWVMRVIDPSLRTTAPWLYAVEATRLLDFLLAATVFVMAWAGRHFYVRAWKGLRHRTADMNTLIAIGTGAAFIYSAAATFVPQLFVATGGRPDVYYEAIIIIIALTIGVALVGALLALVDTQRQFSVQSMGAQTGSYDLSISKSDLADSTFFSIDDVAATAASGVIAPPAAWSTSSSRVSRYVEQFASVRSAVVRMPPRMICMNRGS